MGRLPPIDLIFPAADQIKAYKKAKTTNQFNIGKNQYYGYYNRDSQACVIEQTRITR